MTSSVPTPKVGVFLALTFEDQIFKDYHDPSDLMIQNIIMGLRSDGSFGFIGGMVEPGETEMQALIRECLEEANIDITDVVEEIERVNTHIMDKGMFHAVVHHLRISKDEAINIMRGFVDASHVFTETAGLVSVPVVSGSTFPNNSFMPSISSDFKVIGKNINSDGLQMWGNYIASKN